MKITEEMVKSYFEANKDKIENAVKINCKLDSCKIEYSFYRAEEYAFFDVECEKNVKIVVVVTGATTNSSSIFKSSYLCKSSDILSYIRELKIKSLE